MNWAFASNSNDGNGELLKMNALVVDDSQLVRRLVSAGLQELGMTDVIEVESADRHLPS
jgi:hypothetical protein